MNLDLGYSDEVDLFFNGHRVFSGKSRYQGRDPSFLGIVGLHDQVPVQARKGLNEIFLMVTEVFGGWGFMVQAEGGVSPKPTDHAATEEAWVTPDVFLTPESVLKDPERDVLYVTSFDTDFARKPQPSGFVSRLSLEGEILELRWVEGLNAPAGMDIWRDTLYVAERQASLGHRSGHRGGGESVGDSGRGLSQRCGHRRRRQRLHLRHPIRESHRLSDLSVPRWRLRYLRQSRNRASQRPLDPRGMAHRGQLRGRDAQADRACDGEDGGRPLSRSRDSGWNPG